MKKAFVGQKNLFYNSEAIIVDYHDILKAPRLLALYLLITACESADDIDGINDLKVYSMDEFVEWYLRRKFDDLGRCISSEQVEIDRINHYVNEIIENTPTLLEVEEVELKFSTTLKTLSNEISMVKIYIFTEEYSKSIENDIKQNYGENFQYVYGSYKDVISTLPTDITYVIRDINKINDIKDTGRLNMSSILLPNCFRFNRYDDGRYVIDIEKLMEDNVFLFNEFVAL